MRHAKLNGNPLLVTVCFAASLSSTPNVASAISFGADFLPDYSYTDLGSVSGLPPSYGGLTLLPNDPNTLLIGGNANNSSGKLYTIGVTRDTNNHINGFSGSASPFRGGSIGEYNDGGVTFGPDEVLFTAQWPVNNLGQTKPGSTDEDKVTDLSPLGVSGSSIAALDFVPSAFAGAGQMKLVSWSSGNWYDAMFSPDGSGTFNIGPITQVDLDSGESGTQSLPGGPEGFVYVNDLNPGFSTDSLLVADWSADRVSAYDIDNNGDPLVTTRRDFLLGLTGAEGAFIDPITGDFLFSTFGGGDRIFRVAGFTVPDQPGPDPDPTPSAVPEPAGIALLALGLLLGITFRPEFR